MSDPPAVDPGENPTWRALLLGTDPQMARARARLKHLPSEPRCKMCGAPFGGIGSPLMRVLGRDRWAKNPKYCRHCFNALSQLHGGAEIEASFLFADVRGSTALAEQISPTEFRVRLDRFYVIASRILIEYDAVVDKFVGDEVIGIFIPALTHDAHAARAIGAGLALLRAMQPVGDEASLPIGIGVATGVAFVGAIGAAPSTEFSALGDIVNTTARLASAAGAGELLVTDIAAREATFDTTGHEHRQLQLKGKVETVPVVVLTAEVA